MITPDTVPQFTPFGDFAWVLHQHFQKIFLACFQQDGLAQIDTGFIRGLIGDTRLRNLLDGIGYIAVFSGFPELLLCHAFKIPLAVLPVAAIESPGQPFQCGQNIVFVHQITARWD